MRGSRDESPGDDILRKKEGVLGPPEQEGGGSAAETQGVTALKGGEVIALVMKSGEPLEGEKKDLREEKSVERRVLCVEFASGHTSLRNF